MEPGDRDGDLVMRDFSPFKDRAFLVLLAVMAVLAGGYAILLRFLAAG
jgi:hypothetical protein